MKTKLIINALILLNLAACFDGGIRPLGGSHNGNPDAKAYEDNVVEQHCSWVDACAGDITFDGCVREQGIYVEHALEEIRSEDLKINFNRYKSLSCTVVDGSFNKFTNRHHIINLWRNESFLQPTQ